jgi:hypothetical protein
MPLGAAGLEPLVGHEPATSDEAVPVVRSACSALGGLSSRDMGKWHLGSDPESRSPVDFGFDEAV